MWIHSGKLERWYPVVGGLLLACVFAWVQTRWVLRLEIKDLMGAVINVSAILVGFISTAKAILFSLPHSKRLKQIQQAGKFADLVSYMMTSIYLGLLTAAASGGLLMLNQYAAEPWYFWILVGWVFLAAWMGLSAHRSIRCISVVLSEQPSASQRVSGSSL